MEDGRPVDGSIFFYAPNKAAPIFFAVAFAASGVLHAWQCVHYKSWRLSGLYVLCAFIFTAGFIMREVGAYHYDNVNIYIAATVLVYTAPPLLELANYYVLGRILYYVPHLSPLHPGRVLTTFAAISSVIEVLNGNGAANASNASLPPSRQNMGHNLLKAALLMQVVVVCAFVGLTVAFHRRTCRAGMHAHSSRLTNVLATLYASTALLFVRTIYRVVEYFSIANLHYLDPDVDPLSFSVIIRYEWFFYVFEASLMLCNTWLINIRHPRRYLPASTKTYLAPDGVTEVTGPGYKDDRPFVMTLVDPFDLYGLLKGRDQKTKFWDLQENGQQDHQQQQQQQQQLDPLDPFDQQGHQSQPTRQGMESTGVPKIARTPSKIV